MTVSRSASRADAAFDFFEEVVFLHFISQHNVYYQYFLLFQLLKYYYYHTGPRRVASLKYEASMIKIAHKYGDDAFNKYELLLMALDMCAIMSALRALMLSPAIMACHYHHVFAI